MPNFKPLDNTPWINQDVASYMSIEAIQKLRDMKQRPKFSTEVRFLKDQDGNWFRQDNASFLGTEEGHYEHMMKDNDWTLRDVINDVMEAVNGSLEDK